MRAPHPYPFPSAWTSGWKQRGAPSPQPGIVVVSEEGEVDVGGKGLEGAYIHLKLLFISA